MSYNWLTQYNSPNYTPANRVQATWGRPRTIEAIAIHWWGDPNTGPSFEGVVNYLCRANGSSSAHLVATGTGRKVACIVNFADASWATNSANPYTISIECDPRCRPEDYDTIAELIAQLRQVYGDLPLVPHKQFVATACPGNYDLGRLDRESRNKVAKAEWDWGHVENVPTTPAPQPVKEVNREVYNPLKKFKFNKDSRFYNILAYTVNGDKVYPGGSEVEIKQKLTLSNGNQWYRTAYSSDKELSTGFRAEDLDEVKPPVVTPPVEPEKPVEPKTPVQEPESPSKDGFNENDRNTLNNIWNVIQSIWKALKTIFNIKE